MHKLKDTLMVIFNVILSIPALPVMFFSIATMIGFMESKKPIVGSVIISIYLLVILVLNWAILSGLTKRERIVRIFIIFGILILVSVVIGLSGVGQFIYEYTRQLIRRV